MAIQFAVAAGGKALAGAGSRVLGGASRYVGGAALKGIRGERRGGSRAQVAARSLSAARLKVEFKGFRRLQRIMDATPKELKTALYAASARVGKTFLNHHAKKRLRAKSVSPGLGPVYGTKKGLIGMRGRKVTGTKLSNLKLHMFINSSPAMNLEYGRLVSAKGGGSLRIPMDAAKTTRGKPNKVALRQARAGKLKVITINGKHFLAKINKKAPKGKRLTFLFHFSKTAQMRPRFQFYKTWKAYTPKAMKSFRSRVGYALAAARSKGGRR